MEPEVPGEVQVAPPDRTPGPRVTHEEVKAEYGTGPGEKDRGLLLLEHPQGQEDPENH